MAMYRFRFEGSEFASRELAYELADPGLVDYVAKQAARQMAAREMAGGRFPVTRNLVVVDSDDLEVARYPLTDFISVG